MASPYRSAMTGYQLFTGTSPSRTVWLTLPQSTISTLRSRAPSTTHSPYSIFTSSSHCIAVLLYRSQSGPSDSPSSTSFWYRMPLWYLPSRHSPSNTMAPFLSNSVPWPWRLPSFQPP